MKKRETLSKIVPPTALVLLFWSMDLILRIMGSKIDFYPAYSLTPNLFSLAWIILFAGIIINLKGIWSRIAYWVTFGISFMLFLTHAIYYPLTSFYFSFSLLQMADEGSSYLFDTIVHAPKYVYVMAVLILLAGILLSRKITGNRKTNWRNLLLIIIAFCICHHLLPMTLGKGNDNLKWNSFQKARNVYDTYSDSNKSLKLSGLYEYTVRNFYFTFLKSDEKMSKEDKSFLDGIYKAEDTKTSNDYTGLFEGKNVIFLQLEGMDDWLLNEEDTPNLYKLRSESLNFTDHYSIYTGGGSTFNSEFAVNTGFTTPISYNENVYTLNKNTFNQSLAKLFKQEGYRVNAFHMNSSEFYSRGINYKNWGYDNYFSLIDNMQTYSQGKDYELDRQLILDKTFYKEMFQSGEKFLNYIITYTPHTPFTTEKGVGKLVASMKYGDDIPDLSEEEIVRLEVAETDYMTGLLIQALKDNDLYDDTVIVAYADHYLYTINDKTVLDKYKNTENNLINHTPFFIWSSDTSYKEISTTTMQTDILPTVLNLFGIDYNSNNYIGTDALSDDHAGIAFFSDYSWYDGKHYETNGSNQYVNNLIRKNDLTLKYNYFHNK
jgi:phosphoglycerol transferase MdoB-like AlkP superfamily enzyme